MTRSRPGQRPLRSLLRPSAAALVVASLVGVAAWAAGDTDRNATAALTSSTEASTAMPPPDSGGGTPPSYVPNVGDGGAPGAPPQPATPDTSDPEPDPDTTPTTTDPDAPAPLTPTPDSLRRAADRTDRRSFRYTVTLDVAGLGADSVGAPEAALVSGAHDGEQTSLHLDVLAGATGSVGLAELLDLVPDELTDVATVDMVIDDDTLYVTSPLFAGLDDSWGRVDLPGMDVLTGLASTLNGSRNFNPRVILDLLRRTHVATDLGYATLDGVPVRGVAAHVNVGDVLRTHGIPPAALGQAAIVEEATVRVEAWADDTGLLRQVALHVGADGFVQQMDSVGLGEDDLLDLGLMAGVIVRFGDHGAADIDVAVPAGAHDLTPEIDLLPGR